MKILFLGYDDNEIVDFLKLANDVLVYTDKIDSIFVSEFDYVISYGYRYIISKEVIDSSKNGIINLHISYLPWNRGAHPNFWSFIDNTPKGVTIHFIDKGIDTGNILFQKEVNLTDYETFEDTYGVLRNEIEKLFIQNWVRIVSRNYTEEKQIGEGTFHLVRDLEKYNLEKGWKTKIRDIINMNDFDIIDEIEKVRIKNNVNWMDILRLAMTHAPKDTKFLVKKINKADNEISDLLGKLVSE